MAAPDKSAAASVSERQRSGSFIENDGEFVDDDTLMTSQTEEGAVLRSRSITKFLPEILEAMQSGENFIERDDFEQELGSPTDDPLAEDFRCF